MFMTKGKMRKLISLVTLLIFAAFPVMAEAIHTREDVRRYYYGLDMSTIASPYAVNPRLSPDYVPGALTYDAQTAAIDYLMFLRYLAYLDNPITLDPLYNLRAQWAAVVLAENDVLSHEPIKPAGMPEEVYCTALEGARNSDIASLNWMENGIMLTAIEYFARDDGEMNLDDLGHRRWLLHPNMGATGFGLANSRRGLSYVAMYAGDSTYQAEEWDHIAWPAKGAFPADLMMPHLAWSVTLNPDVYDAENSVPVISIAERELGSAELAYVNLSLTSQGGGPCLIFVPDLSDIGADNYEQNQIWDVEISGLKRNDGAEGRIAYTVEMMSIYPVDPAAVEVDLTELSLSAGDSAALSASVIPKWADDLSVVWATSDASVAEVEDGIVTAIASGKCTVTAISVNGRCGKCEVTVH